MAKLQYTQLGKMFVVLPKEWLIQELKVLCFSKCEKM